MLKISSSSGTGLESEFEGLTVKEAAYILRVAPQTVYAWIYQGKLNVFRVMGSIRIERRALESVKSSTCL